MSAPMVGGQEFPALLDRELHPVEDVDEILRLVSRRLIDRMRGGEAVQETWEMLRRDGETVAVELSIWFTPDGL